MSDKSMTPEEWSKILREYAELALKGGWPGVTSPHYALAGAFEHSAKMIDDLAALSSVKGVREEALEEAAAKLDANATNAESDLIRATIRLQAAAIRSLAQTGSGG